jgi:hypothetical protein
MGRGSWVVLLVAATLALPAGCRRESARIDDLNMKIEFARTPPAMGETRLTLMIAEADGDPVADAKVRIEGNMNHAGMVPVFADLEQVSPGEYAGSLNFTMPGDWFILVTATLADGRTVEKKIDVPGVTAS